MLSSCRFFVTWGYSGLLSRAPGTWGSLFAIPLWLVLLKGPKSIYLLTWLFLLGLSFFAVNYYQEKTGQQDPKEIVIDEVLGLGVAWFFISFESLFGLVISFILFRVFDIFKPFPISWLDKNFKNSFGVIGDDLLAGLFAGLLYLVINFLGGLV